MAGLPFRIYVGPVDEFRARDSGISLCATLTALREHALDHHVSDRSHPRCSDACPRKAVGMAHDSTPLAALSRHRYPSADSGGRLMLRMGLTLAMLLSVTTSARAQL